MSSSATATSPVRRSIFRASLWKVVFMRLLALTLLGHGILEWADLLGAVKLGTPGFFTLNIQGQAAVIFFAVADLVAAIGLWLTATWGVVVWLAAAAIRIARHTAFAAASAWDIPSTVAEGSAILVFFVLVLLTAREHRREIARQRASRRSHSND